jgi:hypothetical protein
MAGIFNGIKDTFTGGGGTPDFEGMSDQQRNQLIKRQLSYGNTASDLLAQLRNQNQSAYQANQNLLPLAYQNLGVQPTYDQNGQVVGYQNTGNTGPDMQSAQGQEFATARMLGLNPYSDANGRVDWGLTAGSGDFLGHGYLGDQRGFFNQQEGALYNDLQPALQQAYAQFQQPQFQAEGLDAMRGQLASAQALQGAPQFNAEGIDAMRGQLSSAQALQNQPMFQAQGIPALQEAVSHAHDLWSLPQFNLEGMDAMRQHLAAAQELQNAPQFNLEGLDAQRGNVQLAKQLQSPELQRMGMRLGAGGTWENDPTSPEAQARTLSGQYLTQAQQALTGQASIDPTITRQLDEQERALNQRLQNELGPGYATTTAGQQALSDFSKRKSEAIYSSNQDLAQRSTQGYQGLQGINLSTLQALYGINTPLNQTAGQLANMSSAQQQARQADLALRNQILSAAAGDLSNASLAQQGARQSDLAFRMNALTGAGQALFGASVGEQQAQQAQLALRNQILSNAAGNLFGASVGQQQARQSDVALRNQILANSAQNLFSGSVGQEQARIAANNARMQNLSNTGQMLQGILGTQAQGNVAYQNALNNTAFGTIGAMAGSGAGYDTALQRQGTTLNQLYGGIGNAYRDTGLSTQAALAGQLGAANTALPWAEAQWKGDVSNSMTNPNNMFWRNFFGSAGSSLGSTAGSFGLGALGGGGGGGGGAAGGGMGFA